MDQSSNKIYTADKSCYEVYTTDKHFMCSVESPDNDIDSLYCTMCWEFKRFKPTPRGHFATYSAVDKFNGRNVFIKALWL